jgi:integrase
MTGCRKNEILKLKWPNISYEEKCLRLEDSKTGSKRVPVSDQTISILRSLEIHKCSDYVIAGKDPSKPLQGLQKVWERIRSHAGLEDVRLHDLRHNFASQLLSAGHELAVIGRVLGHKSMASTHRYAHLSDHSVRAALSDFDILASKVKTDEKV